MNVLAICCADLHLSEKPPVARSVEKDWLAAQARPLEQVREVAERHKCPVIYAGDIFDRHDPHPLLINWAIENLPDGFAVPGQHDLPMHRYEDLGKSAYWTLVEAQVIQDLKPGVLDELKLGSRVWGWPWGVEVENVDDNLIGRDEVNLAVIHSFIWTPGLGYEGSPESALASAWGKRLLGYDVAVFGDNHQGFAAWAGDCPIYNCGCLIRRRSDERGLRPAVGLLMEDGTIQRHYLDVEEDWWADLNPAVVTAVEGNPTMREFLDELAELGPDSLDYREAIQRYMRDRDVAPGVAKVLMEGLER